MQIHISKSTLTDEELLSKLNYNFLTSKYLIQDYAYLLKEDGILYSITDVEDLHNWHVETLDSSPLFERIDQSLLEADPCLACMKNTDEARKVKRNNGSMFYAAWKRVSPKINTFDDLLLNLSKQKFTDLDE